MPEKIMNVQPFTNPMMYVPKGCFLQKVKEFTRIILQALNYSA